MRSLKKHTRYLEMMSILCVYLSVYMVCGMGDVCVFTVCVWGMQEEGVTVGYTDE